MELTNQNKRNNLFASCIKHFESTLDCVNKYSNNRSAHISSLRGIAKEYSQLDIVYNRSRAAYIATDLYFQAKDDCIEESQKVFEKLLQKEPERSYEDHPIWQAIGTVSDDGITPLAELASEIELSNRSIDEEGIVPSQFEPPVDPITKKLIKNPCRNRICGHVYEYNSIVEHLKRIKLNKVKPRCPYIGCTNTNMAKQSIIEDDMLRDQILTYNSQNTEEDRDDSMSEIL